MEKIFPFLKGFCFRPVALLALSVAFTPLMLDTTRSAPVGTGTVLGTSVIEFGRPLRIVAFGSSSTEGIGATNPNATYPAQLQSILTSMLPNGRKVQVINRGISGEDADNMVQRLRIDVIARRPDLVIWQTGSNDPFHHVPLDRFERETRDGIADMQEAGIKVILMEPQWCPKLDTIADAIAYRDILRRIGRDLRVEVIRRSDLMHDWIRDGMLTRQQMLARDGLHMTDGGYALLARSAASKVMKVEDFGPMTRTSTAMP